MFSKDLSDYDVSVLTYLYDRELRSLQKSPHHYPKIYSSQMVIFADPDLDGISSAAQIYRRYADSDPDVIFARGSDIADYFQRIDPDVVYFADMYLGRRHVSEMQSFPWYDSAEIFCVSDKELPDDLDPKIRIMHTPGKSTSRKTYHHNFIDFSDDYATYGHPYRDSWYDDDDVLDYYELAEDLRVAEELALLGEYGDGIRYTDYGKSALLDNFILLDSAIKYSYRKRDFDFLNILLRALAYDESADPYIEHEILMRNSDYQTSVRSGYNLLEKNIVRSGPDFAIIDMPAMDYRDYPMSVAASSLRKEYHNVFAVFPHKGDTCQLLWRGSVGAGPLMKELRYKYGMRGGGHFDYEKSAGSLLVKKKHVSAIIRDIAAIYNLRTPRQ